MNDESNREKQIFEQAFDLESAEERQRFLRTACGDDARLFGRIEGLLEAGKVAEEFLPEQPHSQPPKRLLTEKPGDWIGRYKLLQQIGEGGCGVVYMAEQEEPVRRRVALKVIRLGMDTKGVIARFEAERQALALMDHPNIAKVLDAGATETGRPYFVMELVRGIKITEFCDENNVTTADRLKLFMQVCQAIQHAHQRGIIHRDIKPSNILVTINDGMPVPKVIDFGIAKATAGRLTDHTLFTAFDQFIGTPAYMSPEQAVMTSLDIDTRSDIYSLGVLLYELLVGCTPFDQKELLAAGLDEMRRTIREKMPPKPSTRLSTMVADALTATAQHRHTDAPKLIHVLRGDLDWIVMKCLEKDRSRRYETANGLAADIGRYLKNEPIVARPPSKLYEFQKTVRRHRFGFAAAAAIIIVLAVGIALTSWQAVRATRAERAQARLLQESLQATERETELHQQAERARANEAVLRVEAEQAQRSETMLREQAEAARTNEVGLRQRAEVAERIAQYEAGQLGEALRKLGKLDLAEKYIRDALAMEGQLQTNNTPERAALLNNLANVLVGQEKNLPEAEKAAREALALRKELLGSDHPDVAKSLDRLGMALRLEGKFAEAEAAYLEALSINKKHFGVDHEEVLGPMFALAGVAQADGRIAEAEARYNETLSLARNVLGDQHPYVHSVLNISAQMLYDQGRAVEAEPLARECLANRQRRNPEEWLTFTTQNLLGGILLAQRKYEEVEPLLLSSYNGVVQQTSNAPEGGQAVLNGIIQNLIQFYDTTGQPQKASQWRSSIATP